MVGADEGPAEEVQIVAQPLVEPEVDLRSVVAAQCQRPDTGENLHLHIIWDALLIAYRQFIVLLQN